MAKPFKDDPNYLAVLVYLLDKGPQTVMQISRGMGILNPTAQTRCKKLADIGQLQSSPSIHVGNNNRTVLLYSLTDAGRQAAEIARIPSKKNHTRQDVVSVLNIFSTRKLA